MSITLIFSGCKTSEQKQAKTTEPMEESAKEAVIEELSGYPIPTSFEITKMIYEAGASYIISLSNPVQKVGEYISRKEKALNLGVYGTDLSYASTYMMKQETMQYLESSRKLIEEMEITTAFNVDYAGRVENNLDNRDSLILIISDSFYDTWNYLTQNEMDELAILILSGSWIEGLYITANIALTAKDNTKFLEVIANQKNSLGKLIEVMDPLKNAENVADIYKGLLDLSKVYEQVEGTLNEEQLEQVLNIIEPLRKSIV